MSEAPFDDTKFVYNPDTGITSNYFGGVGRPDGDWHGHIDVDEDGNMVGEGRDVGVKK